MKKIIDRHTISFKNAFAGIFWAFKTQPNYQVHFFLSFVSLLSAVFLRISYFEWLVIILLIFLGFVIETINTALEAATDAIDRRWRQEIKIAKDVSAAAMLIFAIGASVLAIIIFIPKIILLF